MRSIAFLFLSLFLAGQLAAAPLPNEGADNATTREINRLLNVTWKAKELRPSKQCSDLEYLRRVTLDIIGRIPTPEEIAAFEKDTRADRRARLVERLLKSEEYSEYWASVWTSWLMEPNVPQQPIVIRTPFAPGHVVLAEAPRPATLYLEQMQVWLEEQFSKDRSFEEIVTHLLTDNGATNDESSVNFILAHVGSPLPIARRQEGEFDMVPITLRSLRLFLGYRLDGLPWQDESFNGDWKLEQFWSVNAFFRQCEREGTPLPAWLKNKRGMAPPVLTLRENTQINKPVHYTNQAGKEFDAPPVFLDGRKMPGDGKQTRRQVLAKFFTSHPNFTRAYVNRMWGQFFGRGLCERPDVDDLGKNHKVLHPELLDRLARDFANAEHHPKTLIRWICASDAYQLSSAANDSNAGRDREAYFARMPLKRMSRLQLYESLAHALKLSKTLKGEPDGDNNVRSNLKKTVWLNWEDAEASWELAPALWLMHDKHIYTLTGECVSPLRKQTGGDSLKMIESMYLLTLGRRPTKEETLKMQAALQEKPGDKISEEAWQDLLLALLNSNEFVLNH
jgi:hypothetical protein